MKELIPLAEFTGALILSIIIVPLGLIYSIVKFLLYCFNFRPALGIKRFISYILFILLQIYKAIKFILHESALALDYFGNAVAGELLEDFVTVEIDTLFGRGDITISAAIGQLEEANKLNNKGRKLSKILSIIFEKDHCINAWNKEKLKLMNKN